MAEPAQSLYLAELLDSGRYSDLTIICHEQQFKVHKAVVCAQSDVIAKPFELGTEYSETQVNSFTVKGFHVDTVKRFLQFLYRGEYDTASLSAHENHEIHVSTEEGNDHPANDSSTSLQTYQTLLLQHIKALLANRWSVEVFVAVAERISDKTACTAFRDMMATVAAEHIIELTQHDRFDELDVAGPFSCGVIKAVAAKLEEAENLIQGAKIAFDTADQENERIRQCFAVLEETQMCRHCGKSFNCYVEDEGIGTMVSDRHFEIDNIEKLDGGNYIMTGQRRAILPMPR
ncbi:hypothetical protein PWT90_08155 [Aphanocladium album]|nr:hypothetical protein PWT90_08155 [Aphanocladium album]